VEVTVPGLVPRRRPYPGAPFELSALALSLDGTRDAVGAEAWVARLRRARADGITTFDTVDASDPLLAETLLARAFPEGDDSIVVLTASSTDGASSRATGRRLPAPPSPAPGVTDHLSSRSSRGRFQRLFEIPARSASTRPRDWTEVGPDGSSSEAAPRVLRCRTVQDVELASTWPPPRLLSGPYSLVDQGLVESALEVLGPGGFTWIGRDPFAGGRLDGTRFSPQVTGSVRRAPPTLRELEVDFASVARWGFLARARRRTLAQAALRFVSARPWVVATCLLPPPAERWREIIGFANSLPLEDGELARVQGLADASRSGPANAGERR